MSGTDDECIIFTCEVWFLLLGQILALAYIRLMFGVEHAAGQPPKYCALNIEPRGLPLRMVQGSLYLWDWRIHHWVVYTLLLPVFTAFQLYAGIGFAVSMVAHGLWYDDRFEFRYTDTRYAETGVEEEKQEFEEPMWDQTPTAPKSEVPLTAVM